MSYQSANPFDGKLLATFEPDTDQELEASLEAGVPEGAYTNLRVSYDQVNRPIDHPRVKGVAFTGSVEAGKTVAARAGQNLKKSTLELGGSNAFIVLEDDDLEQLAPKDDFV